MRVIIILISASAVAPLGLGCDGGEDDESGIRIVATTGIVADISEEVASDDAEVTQLIPDSASPHDFQLSAEDRQDLEEADLIVANGTGLEPGVPIDDVDAPTWVLTDNAGELRPNDPHVWMDPTRVAGAVPSLADAIAEVDEANADAYRGRALEYERELRAVDRDVAREVADIPAEDRKLVTSHDALGYFADRYGFEVVATAFPATGAEAEPSAAKLREVASAIGSAGVPAVFAEAEDDPSVLEGVTNELDDLDVDVVTDLLVETPGSAGSYVEMLRHDAGLIVSALAG